MKTSNMQAEQTAKSSAPGGANDGTISKVFRLMDLPAEIRNRIYSYALPGKKNIHSRNVADFRIPALTRVSSQVRKETQPIFFSETNFVFAVGTNAVPDLMACGSWNNICREMDRLYTMAGTLSFKKVVLSFIKKAGDAAIFRDVTFEVGYATHIRALRYKDTKPYRPARPDVSLRLVVEPGMTLRTEGNPLLYPDMDFTEEEQKDLDAILQAAIAIAQDIAAQEGFKGFFLHDLRRIAKAFRVDK